MPIKPENKALYPDNWHEIRIRMQTRANDKCEWCGVVNHAWINRKTREMCLSDEYDAIRIVCTTAHLDHNPANCEGKNLAFLCQKCHNAYDRPHRNITAKKTRMKGQLTLNI
jgi:hypothetical protein